jgi:hypothetical protein
VHDAVHGQQLVGRLQLSRSRSALVNQCVRGCLQKPGTQPQLRSSLAVSQRNACSTDPPRRSILRARDKRTSST